MKRILFVFIMSIYTLLLIGCANRQNPIIYKEINAVSDQSEESIRYKVERVTLSKGYQNIDPNVEVIKKGLDFKILVSLGLVESTGVKITEINKVDNEINIYIENENNTKDSQIVVPQVLIDLKGIKLKDKDNFKFNIINENYEPIKIKLGTNDIISKVNADFQLSTNTLPIINILNEEDKILWELTYNNIFDKHNLETPIIDLSILIDANSGDIIKSSKNFISSFIDEGHILDYIPNKSILYKKSEGTIKDANLKDSLWQFNIDSNDTRILYASNSKIECATPNASGEHIALIESHEGLNSLYIIEALEQKAYKVLFKEEISPSLVRWKDNKELYILNKKGKSSSLYKYNISENTTKPVASVNKDITDFQVMGDSFLITEGNENHEEIKVYTTKNWSQYGFEDYGFKPAYVDDNKIAYLSFNKNQHISSLKIYDTKRKRIYDNIDLNISQYFIIDDGTLGIIEKNNGDNEFTFYKYGLKDKNLEKITNTNSKNVFYNQDKDLLYIDLSIPFESDRSQIIYSIDLSKI